MERFCAFLRGVNVNGRKMLMREVCDVFINAGMDEVSYLLATGNIIFKSDRLKAELKEILQQAMSAYYSYPVQLFVKSEQDISLMYESCPFEQSSENHRYVFICEEGFEKSLLDEFAKVKPLTYEDARVSMGIFYWIVPKGATLDAGFSKALSRKGWQSLFTSRNLNTIEKLGTLIKK